MDLPSMTLQIRKLQEKIREIENLENLERELTDEEIDKCQQKDNLKDELLFLLSQYNDVILSSDQTTHDDVNVKPAVKLQEADEKADVKNGATERTKTFSKKDLAIIAAVGAGAFIAAPVVGGVALSLIGFQAGGIAAGSLAAAMMSASASASGGGVVAGGLVATLQSAGAVGLGSATSAVAGTVASGAAAAVKYLRK